MGSQGSPSKCVFHVTGFKKFHGVDVNPTEVLALRLKDYIEKRGGLPYGSKLKSITVLETAGQDALDTLQALLDSALIEFPASATSTTTTAPVNTSLLDHESGDQIIWVHMGVNGGASKFAIERQAVNEATFRCPDEMGWQPQRVPIVKDDGDISHIRETTLPVLDIAAQLAEKGFNIAVSDDAGRFVCNYVYYHSLHHSVANRTRCVFVHVPPFNKIEVEQQLDFIATLLEVLASLL